MKKTIILFTILISSILLGQYGFQSHLVIDNTFGVSRSTQVDTGDLNGDGFLDIISASLDSGISWFQNLDGQGNFSKYKTIFHNETISYHKVNVADIDNDGILEIVYSTWNGSIRTLWVVKSLDNGHNWEQPVMIFQDFIDFRLIDMDNDGDLDIFYTREFYRSWKRNDGNGNFNSEVTVYSSYSNPVFIDFDNDGDLDLVAQNTNGIFKMTNNGEGVFENYQLIYYSSNLGAESFAIDIDNDGDLDIVTNYRNGSYNSIYCYKNLDGLGNFPQTPISFHNYISTGTYVQPFTSIPSDVNGDGKIDFIVSRVSDNTIYWIKNLGNDQFEQMNDITTNVYGPVQIHGADFNGDSYIDIISSSSSDDKIIIYKNLNGTGNYENTTISSNVSNLHRIEYGDIDNDGDLDILCNNWGRLAWFENVDGLGSFSKPQNHIKWDNSSEIFGTIKLSDLDGDNDLDLIINTDSNKVFWKKNDGEGNFSQEILIMSGTSSYVFKEFGDVNGDGYLDILFIEAQKIKTLINDTNGSFTPLLSSLDLGSPHTNAEIKIFDMDDDGDNDIVYKIHNGVFWVENVDGLGNFNIKHTIYNQGIKDFFPNDLNGDNLTDILITTSNNTFGWIQNLGNGQFSDLQLFNHTITSPSNIEVIDMDGDGNKDILMTATSAPHLFWIKNDNMNFNEIFDISNNLPRIINYKIADINADGNFDILVSERINGKIEWFENLGNYQNQIIGTVRLDVNANGYDENDPIIPNVLISTQNENQTKSTFTSQTGNYKFIANEGTFVTSMSSPLDNYTISPASYTSVFNESGITEVVNFSVAPNQHFDDFEVSIYPLQDARPGFDVAYKMVVKNNGTISLSPELEFLYDNLKLNYINSSVNPTSNQPGILIYNIGEILPFHTKEIDVYFNVNNIPVVNLGDILNFTTSINNIENDQTPDSNVFELNQEVVGSYDPNDILVLEGDEIYLDEADGYLHYIIRFQNTGTYYAQRVRITNTLDDKFQWETIELESASHKNRLEIINDNNLEFIFDAIYLPSANSDEQGSQGYIAYKIKPKSGVQIGDIFNNQAHIFFDYNPAINTNIATTEIIEFIMSLDELDKEQFIIYPNPATKLLALKSSSEIHSITLFSLNGQFILTQKSNKIDISNLPLGVYFIEIKDVKGNSSVKKFIKK